ncbi:Protein of unknown function [Pseudobutyrivibrio sp. 49]|uniref:DUF2975 domain-containing protein n=1 Tax=unclassified Pseudobutyrivibrio TaxID=2638619 RepID=UPI0008857429|nr:MULTISPECIES: DUF2975 domain-containing protein [unclassified Pseudobutyrivibrio]SDH33856.1 Protein of unknown function [Pseudobutyrivibrio sp. 49]SFN48586.1 Protein of unknown function [Pseudobutyrivibrio sp. UC1225]
MDNKLNKFVKTILDICFFIGLIMEIAVPFGLKYAVKLVMKLWGETTEYAQILEHYPYAVVSIMLVGASALMILWELRKMMKTVIRDDCFVQENVSSLVRMSIYAFVIGGLKLLRCFVYFTPAAVIIAGVFIFAGLFSRVLACVFDKAVSYKQENDLTI